jgi:hypothetical protein
MVSEAESTKDTIQVVTESAAEHVGKIATIVTSALRDVAREVGEWVSDLIEMREASQRAKEDDDDA